MNDFFNTIKSSELSVMVSLLEGKDLEYFVDEYTTRSFGKHGNYTVMFHGKTSDEDKTPFDVSEKVFIWFLCYQQSCPHHQQHDSSSSIQKGGTDIGRRKRQHGWVIKENLLSEMEDTNRS